MKREIAASMPAPEAQSDEVEEWELLQAEKSLMDSISREKTEGESSLSRMAGDEKDETQELLEGYIDGKLDMRSAWGQKFSRAKDREQAKTPQAYEIFLRGNMPHRRRAQMRCLGNPNGEFQI